MAVLSVSPETLSEAGRHLRSGGLVGLPTETVYGLAGDATNPSAIAAIFELKSRPADNPLIIHVADLAGAKRIARFDVRAEYLAKRLWPGALTLVLPKSADCPVVSAARAGLDTVAVRVPDHPVALQLIQAAGTPLAAPSANRSGELSPTTAEHVAASFGKRLAMILDGGPCRVGVESTVLDLSGPDAVILRPGGISADTISASIGELIERGAGAVARSPGLRHVHYAPRLPLRLDTDDPHPMEALIAFGREVPEGFGTVINLSPRGDLREAASNLYAALHEIDQGPWRGIAVMPIPNQGIGIAINDRLRRAAARG